jgi:hypothetical protein
MKTPFIPTAMRCTKQQFEAISAKLIKRGCLIAGIYSFDEFPYLVNNLSGIANRVGNIHPINAKDFSREIHKEFNEEIFLRNLGGEDFVKKSLKLTNLQLTNLHLIKQRVEGRIINCEQALESLAEIGYCPVLLNDDNGHWAVNFGGYQAVPISDEPESISLNYFIEAKKWKDSIYEALIWALSN